MTSCVLASSGHMFDRRCGENERAFETGDSSPVFLQWLDVVHQVQRQFPEEFEFDETLLLALADAVYSKWFGTFLLGSERQRVAAELDDSTASFWDYVLANIATFKNPLYMPAAVLYSKGRSSAGGKSGTPPSVARAVHLLVPVVNQSDLVLWQRLFRSHVPHDYTLRAKAADAANLAARVQELEGQLLQAHAQAHAAATSGVSGSPPSAYLEVQRAE